jgi:hypothetical protein
LVGPDFVTDDTIVGAPSEPTALQLPGADVAALDERENELQHYLLPYFFTPSQVQPRIIS